MGTAVPFFIFENDSGALIGGITLGNIRYGVAQTGQIGYWLGERLCRPRPDDGGAGAAHPLLLSRRSGCTGSRQPVFRTTSVR